ncbi:MAG: hypothetical protein MZV70_40870 [Desulfobacterales bacterium]|nr:hypothetical protein [Desulfobacterales bacterium]
MLAGTLDLAAALKPRLEAARGGQAAHGASAPHRVRVDNTELQLLHHHRGVYLRLSRAALQHRGRPVPLRARHLGGQDRHQGGSGRGRLLCPGLERPESGRPRSGVRHQGGPAAAASEIGLGVKTSQGR